MLQSIRQRKKTPKPRSFITDRYLDPPRPIRVSFGFFEPSPPPCLPTMADEPRDLQKTDILSALPWPAFQHAPSENTRKHWELSRPIVPMIVPESYRSPILPSERPGIHPTNRPTYQPFSLPFSYPCAIGPSTLPPLQSMMHSPQTSPINHLATSLVCVISTLLKIPEAG